MRFDSTLRKAGPQGEKVLKSYGYLAAGTESWTSSSEQTCTIHSHTSTTSSSFSSKVMMSPYSLCQEARPKHRKKEPDEKNYEIVTKKEKRTRLFSVYTQHYQFSVIIASSPLRYVFRALCCRTEDCSCSLANAPQAATNAAS